jgi:hypothetical protein
MFEEQTGVAGRSTLVSGVSEFQSANGAIKT